MPSTRFIHGYGFLWLSLALLIVLSLSFLLPLTPQDYWWYLRVGEETLAGGAVPSVDRYSYTLAGTPLVYPAWLAAVLLWLCYAGGGLPATFLMRGLLLGGAYGLFWYSLRRVSGPRLATVLTIILVLSSSSNWSIRPQMFAIPLFVGSLFIFYAWHERDSRLVWMLPLISLLWANIHSSFALIFILGGSGFIFGKGNRKALGAALSLSILTAMINPVGYSIWATVLDAGSIRSISTEWLPPLNSGWQMNIFYAWLLLFIPLAVLSPKKLDLLNWLWFVGLGWLALSGVRFVIWFQFLLAFQTAFLLSDWDLRWLDRRGRRGIAAINFSLAALFLFLPLFLLPGIRDGWWPEAPALMEDTPVAAVEWLKAQPEAPIKMWNDFNFSSYLIFALPEHPVRIDTRMHLVGYTPQQYDQYRAIASARYDWQTMLMDENINLLFLSNANQPALVQAVERSGEWCIAYRDEIATIGLLRQPNQLCP
ncbi:MAG: hypothetical protein RBS68_12980 [Anaerolineales bacterium]|jgi:hypothetical protein|nr:hypothetical protein [Anaerolineales bacterium]